MGPLDIGEKYIASQARARKLLRRENFLGGSAFSVDKLVFFRE